MALPALRGGGTPPPSQQRGSLVPMSTGERRVSLRDDPLANTRPLTPGQQTRGRLQPLPGSRATTPGTGRSPRGSLSGSPARGSVSGSPVGTARRLRSSVSEGSPLYSGLEYAASLGQLDQATADKVLEEVEETSLSVDQIVMLYRAKCADQQLKVLTQNHADREQRFIQFVSTSCVGQMFRLREAGLAVQTVSCIADILENDSNFTVLDLAGNSLKDTGAEQVARLIGNNQTLVHLGLAGCLVSTRGIESLGKQLVHNSTLTSINLSPAAQSRNPLGARGGKLLGEALRHNGIIAVLNLEATGLGDDGVTAFCDNVAGHVSLTDLVLSANDFGPVGAAAVGSFLVQSKRMTHLSLDRNPVGDKGLSALASALMGEGGAPPVLQYLGLQNIKAKLKGLSALCDALRARPQPVLSTLRLDGNLFGDVAGCGLAVGEMLMDNEKLEYLSLTKCELLSAEVAQLARGLLGQKHLQRLDLGENEVCDEGAEALSKALHAATPLRQLDLSRCRIGNQGGEMLGAMLKKNCALTSVNLKQNGIDRGGGVLLEALHAHTGLIQLVMEGNPINFQVHTAIEAALKKNQAIHRKTAVPRLQRNVSSMRGSIRELDHTRDEIALARSRAIADHAELVARRDTARRSVQITKEKEQKTMQQYKKVHAQLLAEQTGTTVAEDPMTPEEEERVNPFQALEQANAQKRMRLEGKLLTEQGGIKKANGELKQVLELLAALQESWGEHLSPLYGELAEAEEQRQKQEAEANRLADLLADAEMRLKMKEGGSPARSGSVRRKSAKRGSVAQ
eukprot:Hpha_TRINITY_DN16680_c2_g18::TRINITY_DN16680_c2_g18_i1::g.182430::m.182430